MNLKLKWMEFRRQLVIGTLAETQPQLALVLSWVLNFVLGAVLAAVPLSGACGPFGIAAAAQAGAELGGLLCALGASCGYLAVFGLQTGIQYVAAVILVFTAGYALRETKLRRMAFFMPALAGGFTLLTCFLGYYTAGAGENPVLPLVTQTLLAFGCTYFFREALRTGERMTESSAMKHAIAVVILLSCVLMALSGAVIAGQVSVGRILALLLVQISAFRGGPLSGSACGLILGLAMDVSSGQAMFYTVAYALSALVSGAVARSGRPAFLIACCACSLLCVLWNVGGGVRTELLLENLGASVVFLLLPMRLIHLLGSFLRSNPAEPGEAGLRRYTARRVSRLAEAFHDLYVTVDSGLAKGCNDENISTVFDRAAEQVCARCKNKSRCWNSEYVDTLSVFGDVSARIRDRGLLRAEDLPQRFLESCLFPEDLITAVNGELRGRMYRRQFQARLAENRSAAYQQYLDLAEVLSGVSQELENAYGPDLLAQRRLSRYLSSLDLDADISAFRDRSGRLHLLIESVKLKQLLREPGYMDQLSEAVGTRLCRPMGSDESAEGRITLLEAEPLTVSVGVASLKKSGETVSGDRGTYFKTEQGMLCILLSDGMGSGENAARESVAAVRVLERFLRTGVEPALAMRILNSVMLIKNEDSWGFATVDLLCIDLFSGNAAFYKYGAAPSYVKTGRQIRRVRSESLAAGLTAGADSQPDVVKMRLHPGSLALIASDGVIAESNDQWIRSLLAQESDRDMKALARNMLQTALKQYGSSDDMTVLAVRVDKRV